MKIFEVTFRKYIFILLRNVIIKTQTSNLVLIIEIISESKFGLLSTLVNNDRV